MCRLSNRYAGTLPHSIPKFTVLSFLLRVWQNDRCFRKLATSEVHHFRVFKYAIKIQHLGSCTRVIFPDGSILKVTSLQKTTFFY